MFGMLRRTMVGEGIRSNTPKDLLKCRFEWRLFMNLDSELYFVHFRPLKLVIIIEILRHVLQLCSGL